MTQDDAKRLVAKHGAKLVAPDMKVGLGTGTTAMQFIRALGARNAQTKVNIRCVASSKASADLARSFRLDVVTLNELPRLDLYIDGADEVDSKLNLIKGGGGAHFREKTVASCSDRFVALVDSSKVVATLGRFPLPVEVAKMAYVPVPRKLDALGLNPHLRNEKGTDEPLLTDKNNYILDCHCGPIFDMEKVSSEIRNIVGVVEHGLFLNMSSMCLVADDDGAVQQKHST